MTNCQPVVWEGCYQGNYDLWCPEAYQHPAKMSPALCFRILEHLEELGLLREGMTVLDPMGGVGTSALVAVSLGFKAISVELEARFVQLQKDNKAHLERRLHRELDWTIIQGDSRYLSKLLTERGVISVTSPPYADAITGGRSGIEWQESWGKESETRQPSQTITYGSTPGQIGQLPDKPLTVMSPPYADAITGGRSGIEWQESWGKESETRQPSQSISYGQSDGQIGAEKSESYLSAMSLVYAEIARVSNVLVIVLKNPTRNGQLRRLDLDSIALLEAGGWTIRCIHEARLFTEHEHQDLFGETHKKVKGRLSFFKRLSYQKGGVVADHEDILVAVREGAGLVTVSSPPYGEGVAADYTLSGVKGSFSNATLPALNSNYGSTHGQIGNLRDR